MRIGLVLILELQQSIDEYGDEKKKRRHYDALWQIKA
jgi:hypothetical protein